MSGMMQQFVAQANARARAAAPTPPPEPAVNVVVQQRAADGHPLNAHPPQFPLPPSKYAQKQPIWALVDGVKVPAYFFYLRSEKVGIVAIVWTASSGFRVIPQDDILAEREEQRPARKGRRS